MLNFKNISLRRGERLLFSGLSFIIHKGQKVGVTGANGTGKSSLFAMIRNIIHSDEGDLSMPQGIEIAHVAQETPAISRTAIDYIIDGDRKLRIIQQQLADAELANNGIKQAEIHVKLDDIGGYTAQSRASRLMDGLGFLVTDETRPVMEFSGGWRMRLNLAQALMSRSDMLLLDEPTNHLDLDAVIWLQDWLIRYPGTLLLISHDRDFLDAIADHIMHIEQNSAQMYTGNYTVFERLRAEKLAQQQAAYEQQQKEIAHIQSFIDRFRVQATKAKQAQSRIKTLERMNFIAQAHVDSPFNFSFKDPGKIPNQLLTLESADIGYGDKAILKAVDLFISPGDRIGLLGKNGAGKSTLVKCLAGEISILSGVRQGAEALDIGYFAQHQLEQLRVEESPLWHLQHLDPLASEKELRNFLGGFDFVGDKVLGPVRPFSGGEKARLVLAILVYQNPNLLLLDEPTNHLDLEMRHALSMALQDYRGALIVVSHDRHLIRSVTDKLIFVDEGTVQVFSGDLDDYQHWVEDKKNINNTEKAIEEGVSRKDQRRLEAEKRKKLKPLRDILLKVEKTVDQFHREQTEIEQALSDATIYQEAQKEQLKKILKRKGELDLLVQGAENRWLEITEEMESFDGG
ncbi:MAG: ATP-binding cassette domain-containing protein [Methylococcales bacterium]|nr:ATP-binding cassette domain-containing protein [Methylococcaceae bacterium]HIL40550.1 ATP-binding cassette domain-containing protein [Methylococcales bacterium]